MKLTGLKNALSQGKEGDLELPGKMVVIKCVGISDLLVKTAHFIRPKTPLFETWGK